VAIQYGAPLDRTFHALGDGTRRAMLAMLARSPECSAGELGAPFDIAQPTASKHLRVLERAGLVTRRVVGREHRYRLREKPLRDAEGWITRHRALWHGALDQLGNVLAGIDRRGA
jgi:DNA-binding transcriptional ArsR family regulator